VKRALLNWNTGTKNVLHGPPGYFSKTNWGDNAERHGGCDILVKKASSLMKVTKKLKPIQWKKIVDSAHALAKSKKVVDNIDMTSDTSDLSSLVDGDDDLHADSEPARASKSESEPEAESDPIQDEDENGSVIYF
jgi:hypothetical protein